MKFRQHKMYSGDDWTHHVFILTGQKAEYRLYVFWDRNEGVYPLPVELQRRRKNKRIEIWPKRRRHKPKGWSPRAEDTKYV